MRAKTGTPLDDAAAKTIFRFEVQLLGGPVTPSFVDRHPEAPSRIIDIRGDQTLEALHWAIFKAFDREDAHLYEFQIGGKKPMDRNAANYGLITPEDDDYPKMENAETTSIAALGLKIGSSFFYWFDFGDDWWHEVRLLALDPPAEGKGQYPRIVEKKGESPPQYADWDAEEDYELSLNDDQAGQSAKSALTEKEKQRLEEIFALAEDFCKSQLTEDYVEVCKELLESIRGTWLSLERGKAQSWAAGIVHAAGMINFLGDPTSKPHLKLREIAGRFGVSAATMEKKSREIREALNTFPLDPRFCLPERLLDNPLVWMKEINGLIIDFRLQSPEVQEAALQAGLIPFIPELAAESDSPEEEQENSKENGAKDESG